MVGGGVFAEQFEGVFDHPMTVREDIYTVTALQFVTYADDTTLSPS